MNTVRPDLLDARLKNAEAHAHKAGHKWLRNLCRQKRREAQEAATEHVPHQIRPQYLERKNRA